MHLVGSGAKPQWGLGGSAHRKNFYFQVKNMIGKQYRDNSSIKLGLLQSINIQHHFSCS